jgi:hypothetical protein
MILGQIGARKISVKNYMSAKTGGPVFISLHRLVRCFVRREIKA